jgi:hypothetical protein
VVGFHQPPPSLTATSRCASTSLPYPSGACCSAQAVSQLWLRRYRSSVRCEQDRVSLSWSSPLCRCSAEIGIVKDRLIRQLRRSDAQRIHKYSALFVLICSPRAAMAAMRSLSIASLACQGHRVIFSATVVKDFFCCLMPPEMSHFAKEPIQSTLVRVLPGPPCSLTLTEISQFSANSPEQAGIRAPICLCNLSIGFPGPLWGLCLCLAKSRFPMVETGVGGDSVRMLGQWDEKPSISRCLDHSAGKSVRRASPMPHGSPPSMAALTRPRRR